MSYTETALATGTTNKSIDKLLRGRADTHLASILGVPKRAVQDFINGKANVDVAWMLHIPTDELQSLRNKLDKEGAVGLVLGVALGLAKE